jgi:xylulokinase
VPAFVIGVDLGTQSVKAVACDDRLVVRGAHAVAVATHAPRPGWAEQDPGDWEAALAPAIAGALAAAGAGPGDVAALAVAGQLDGCVAVDAAGEPLHRALIWHDRRAVDFVGAPAFEVTGQVADPSHFAPKLAWLRAHGVRAARFHQPTSYVVARLTGAHVLDPAHASTTMLYDLAACGWSPALLAAYAIDERALPAIAPATAIAGALHAGGARATGLPVGTPVAVGTGDDFATPLGAGIVAPGVVAVALGTAEVVGTVTAARVLDRVAAEPLVETHAFPTGAYFVEHPGWLSGGAVRWATRLLGVADDAALDRLAASIEATDVTFVPALAGAMTPVWRPSARGSLHGLAAAHGPADIARAVLAGLAFACRDVVDRLAALALPTPEVTLLGGGAASAVWAQLRADILARPHHLAARGDTCAVGAAMIAAVAAGQRADLGAAAACAPPPRMTVLPRDATRAACDEAYARYRDIVTVLAPSW